MTNTIEIHAGEGGDDAHTFARELATAIGRHTGGSSGNTGRIVTVTAAHGL